MPRGGLCPGLCDSRLRTLLLAESWKQQAWRVAPKAPLVTLDLPVPSRGRSHAVEASAPRKANFEGSEL